MLLWLAHAKAQTGFVSYLPRRADPVSETFRLVPSNRLGCSAVILNLGYYIQTL